MQSMKLKSYYKPIGMILILLVFFGIGMAIPQRFSMPVQGAKRRSYNQESFWYYPWGKSVTHKGVDIFEKIGTPILSSTAGLVLYSGEFGIGGCVVVVLGPKWRLHYYAHLKESNCHALQFLSRGEMLGKLGDSGNAKGKPPHLHYSIFSLIPHIGLIDNSMQGWKKMFILNPIPELNKVCK